MLLPAIPPAQLLASTPRLASRTRRRRVINDPAIIRPCKAPTVPQISLWFTFICLILSGPREYSRIDPAAARSAAIILQRLKTFQQLPVRHAAPIDLLKNFLNIRLGVFVTRCVIPGTPDY